MIRKAVSYVFMTSVTVAWLAFFAAPSLIFVWLTPSNLADIRDSGLLWVPAVIVGLICAFLGAGVYYVVGRKILIWIRLWHEFN